MMLNTCPEKLDLIPNKNNYILEFQKGFSVFYLITDMCSCDLLRSTSHERDRLINKYKKKGWSNAKIKRALSSIDSLDSDVQSEARAWLGQLVKYGEGITFHIHWYTGEPDYENIIITERREISRSDFVNGLINLKEDVLYIIRN